jgi:hypothetical protein
MAVKDKKQLSIIEENVLLEEQQNLQKSINKLLNENLQSQYKIKKSISEEIKDLAKTHDFQEQIDKSLTIEKQLRKEIKDFKDFDVDIGTQIGVARKAGDKALRNALEGERRQIRAEMVRLNILKDQNNEIKKNAPLLLASSNLTTTLRKKAAIMDALGLSRYTSGITTTFGKIAMLFGKNLKYSNAILNFLNKWYYQILFFYVVLSKAFEIFKEMDKAFFDFRKQWGLIRDDSKQFEDRLFRITKETAHLGVNFSDVVESITKLGREAGSLLYVSDEMISNVAILNKQLGVSTDISVKFLKAIASVSQQSISAQSGMLGLAQAMSSAAKVPLNEVMDDIAKASASSYGYISRNPIQLIKAAVEARRFGTSLSALANTSKTLLNFTESMESEMEAAVLAGRAINLQNARQLSYNKDFVGLNKEIVRLAKEFNYNQMDQFQAAAFAKALGKTEEELGKIIQSSEEENSLLARANKLAREGRPELLYEINARNKILSLSEAELRDKGKKAELDFKNLRNQERLNAITDKWKQILIEVSEKVIPIIDGFLKVIPLAMEFLGVIFSISRAFGTLMGKGKLFTNVVSKFFLAPVRWLASLIKEFALILKINGHIATLIGKTLGKFTFFLNVGFAIWNVIKSIYHGLHDIGEGLGLIGNKGVNVVKILHGLFKITIGSLAGIIEGFFGFVVDIPILILKGLGSLGVETAKKWGEIADSWWNALKDWFGFSPSVIGLLIVKGITSVGNMLVEALTSPFKIAFDFIRTAFGSLGSIIFDSIVGPFKKAWDWISGSFGQNSIQPSIQQSAVSAKSISLGVPIDRSLTDNEIKSYRELDKSPLSETEKREKQQAAVTETESDRQVMVALLAEFKGLRDDLASGKISVNIDGQLVSTQINRGNKFRGTYGAMVG